MAGTFDFLDKLKARIAFLAIGRSTLRNQGARGVVSTAREYLRSINLGEFFVATPPDFEKILERHTQRLMKRFPRRVRKNWGTARKALNIFLRDVVYNYDLRTRYGLANLVRWLELPLDRYAYDGLLKDAEKLKVPTEKTLPKWPGIKHLEPHVSTKLRALAKKIAIKLDTHRVHLDVRYWRNDVIKA